MLWPCGFPIIFAQTCQCHDFRTEVPLHTFFSKILLQGSLGPRRRFQSTAFLGGNIAFLGLKLYWRFHPYLESVLMMSIDNPTSMEPPGAYSGFEQNLAPLHLFALLYLFSILLGRTTQLQRPHMVPKIRFIPFSTVLGKSYGIGSYQQYSYWLGLSQLSTAQTSQCRMELGT